MVVTETEQGLDSRGKNLRSYLKIGGKYLANQIKPETLSDQYSERKPKGFDIVYAEVCS